MVAPDLACTRSGIPPEPSMTRKRGKCHPGAARFTKRGFAGNSRPSSHANISAWTVSPARMDFTMAREFHFEPGADGMPQAVLPGAEQAKEAELAQRRANAP